MKKPCTTCKLVSDPDNCENKCCQLWQRWFISRWDQLRREPRLLREVHPRQPEGTPIGGQHYALPHRVQGYLDNDPCRNCLCPRDLCTIPCRIKRDWQSVRELLQ